MLSGPFSPKKIYNLIHFDDLFAWIYNFSATISPTVSDEGYRSHEYFHVNYRLKCSSEKKRGKKKLLVRRSTRNENGEIPEKWNANNVCWSSLDTCRSKSASRDARNARRKKQESEKRKGKKRKYFAVWANTVSRIKYLTAKRKYLNKTFAMVCLSSTQLSSALAATIFIRSDSIFSIFHTIKTN